jgi:rhomboid protease GluP
MEVLATRDSWWTTQVEAALASQGIALRWVTPWQAEARGAVLLDVPVSELERTSEVLSDQLGEELKRRAAIRPPERWVPLWLQPAFASAACMALLVLVFYAFTGGYDDATPLFRHGALSTRRFFEGEWWRVVTAATLHADAAHVVGNAAFLLVLGWASNERFGSGVTVALWLLTAVFGFGASLVWGEATQTVGASGGLFGLLGAAGGHAVRSLRRDVEFPRRAFLRAFGSAVALLAFTAFGPEANIAAHLGGFVSGFVFGLALPARRMLAGWVQLALALASALVLVGAWLLVAR